MKITCIVGSARVNGSTNYLVDTFIKGVMKNNADAEIKKYSVASSKINFCYGCKECYKDGRCVQNDDVLEIVKDIISSDFVVIAAPSYWADVPGQLKTFFDRNTPFGDTNPNRTVVADKAIKGIAIAVRAGVREAENEIILNAIEHYFGHLGIETIKKISVCQTDTLEDLLNQHQDAIQSVYDIGKNINDV